MIAVVSEESGQTTFNALHVLDSAGRCRVVKPLKKERTVRLT